jgi:hypothetical protein
VVIRNVVEFTFQSTNQSIIIQIKYLGIKYKRNCKISCLHIPF